MESTLQERKPQTRVKNKRICPICCKGFRYPSELVIHFNSNHRERRCLFADCFYNGKGAQDLIDHYRENHIHTDLDKGAFEPGCAHFCTSAGALLHATSIVHEREKRSRGFLKSKMDASANVFFCSDFVAMQKGFNLFGVQDPRRMKT